MKKLTIIKEASKPSRIDVENFANSIDVNLPDDLIEFLTNQNPIQTQEDAIEVTGKVYNIISWYAFGPDDGYSFEETNRQIVEDFEKAVIAFASDSGGFFYVISIRPSDFGKVYFHDYEYDIETEESEALILLAPNFESFVNALFWY
jgi:hypothetical protein